jgi:hypothetical protein
MYKFNSFGGRDCFRLIDNIFSTTYGINLVLKKQTHGPFKKFSHVFGSTMLFILLYDCRFLMSFSILWIYYLSICINDHLPFSDLRILDFQN